MESDLHLECSKTFSKVRIAAIPADTSFSSLIIPLKYSQISETISKYILFFIKIIVKEITYIYNFMHIAHYLLRSSL